MRLTVVLAMEKGYPRVRQGQANAPENGRVSVDRAELSGEIIGELGQLFVETLTRIAPELVACDLDGIERLLQQTSRNIMGRVVERAVEAIGAAETRIPNCLKCHQPMGLVDPKRKRDLDGLVGDYRLLRPYYACDRCEQQTSAPLDERLGIGSGKLSPGLGRVAARLGIEESFVEDSSLLEEVLGVRVADEPIRRITEGIGAVAEAEEQAAIALAKAGKDPVGADRVQPSEALVVQVDGVKVRLIDDWHEAKVGLVASLGPELVVDKKTGRTHLRLEAPDYFAGLEAGEEFWWRAYVAACRRGLGSSQVKLIELLGDGSDWIWRHGRSFLDVAEARGAAAVEIIEVLDICHANEHLWKVGNVVFGIGTAAAAAWVEPLKKKLVEEGPGPILEALGELAKRVPTKDKPEAEQQGKGEDDKRKERADDANKGRNKRKGEGKKQRKDKDEELDPAEEVRKAIAYFTEHSARMDYPGFLARNLPIGSGAVESTCKEREKGAGMRWTREGAQAVATLRAVQRSGRWQSFWQTRPQRRRPLVFPGPRKPVSSDPEAANRAA